MYGSDQAASIETNALRNFVESVRAIPSILGNGEKVLSEADLKTREKLRINVPA
jgi:sialic acid synthase SpsE